MNIGIQITGISKTARRSRWRCVPPLLLASFLLYGRGEVIKPLLTISQESMPQEINLVTPIRLAFNSRNELFVCDIATHNIKIFAKDGTFIKTIGQKGSGPGDLASPSRIAFDGRHIIVWEISNRRLSFFDENGHFIRIVRPNLSLSLKKMRINQSGKLVVEIHRARRGKTHSYDCLIGRLDKELAGFSELFKKNIITRKYTPDPQFRRLPVPYPPLVSWDLMADGRLVVGFQGEYKIFLVDPVSGRKSSFTHYCPPVPVSDQDKQSFFESLYIAGISIKKSGTPASIRRYTTFPKYKPVFREIWVNHRNEICVVLNSEHTGNMEIDLFDEEGTFIKQLSLPSNAIGFGTVIQEDGSLWTIRKNDDLDNEIVKYRFMDFESR